MHACMHACGNTVAWGLQRPIFMWRGAQASEHGWPKHAGTPHGWSVTITITTSIPNRQYSLGIDLPTQRPGTSCWYCSVQWDSVQTSLGHLKSSTLHCINPDAERNNNLGAMPDLVWRAICIQAGADAHMWLLLHDARRQAQRTPPRQMLHGTACMHWNIVCARNSPCRPLYVGMRHPTQYASTHRLDGGPGITYWHPVCNKVRTCLRRR